MKIITIVGARPQFVKAAVVSRALSKVSDIEELIVHTGQHHDANMSDVFFDEMEIPKPTFNLGIHGLGHGAMTGQMLEGLEAIYRDQKPDRVLVYGDTNSTLAGALAAAKMHIPVAHVEAGLRSFNMKMPEEINRILTDRISDLLFCPTQTAIDNLTKEGYPFAENKLILSGDVMQDAAMYYAQTSASKSTIIEKLKLRDFVLCTLHRAENTDDLSRLKSIIDSLSEIHNVVPVVLPLHPRTQKIVKDAGINLPFTVIDPVGYFDMIEMLKHCSLVMTDSGGLQKEAFFFAKHCITLRDETEWVELVQGGFNKLAGADYNKILSSFEEMRNKKSDFSVNLYGGGKASEKIVNELHRSS
ncbi:MAG TPA: UDP-N-acetylglucosamine 2-epimerase (non-hydrolyzing) [Bacteroidia bacterium]|jgi:UDP-GlcNAc3NAcA epimerase|nr:UDP-N-acetylglucosamine 2-epimerase (non-hydrolyzing) [Bacteroidia bacterium]